MCTRYTLTNMQALAEFCEDLGVALDPESFVPRYNVAPTQPVPVIVEDEGRKLRSMSFGFSLPARPPAKRGLLVVGARSETILEKATFRDAAAHRRCLILADGFYEWEKAGAARLPRYFRLRDGRAFAFAGLWQPEKPWSPAGAAIVTTEPNELLSPYHDRMPVMLGPNSGPAWLGGEPLAPDALARLCRPLPAEMMTGYRVDPRMNNSRYEGADCIVAIPGS